MRKKMEVHALQQAVCKLIVLLDNVFGGKLEGWGRNNCGLKAEVRPVNKPNNVYLDIQPAGWPKESLIFARFYGDDKEGWGLEEGQIIAHHIAIADGTDYFKVSFEVPNFAMPHRASFKAVDKGTPSVEIFKELAAKAGLLDETEPAVAGIREVIEKCRADEQQLKDEVEKVHNKRTGSFEYVYGGAASLRQSHHEALISLLRQAVAAVEKLAARPSEGTLSGKVASNEPHAEV